MEKSFLEIACFNLYSVAIAQRNNVDRIELCKNVQAGGITPDYSLVEVCREITTTKLFIMIRPREGDFVYNESEFEQMKKDIIAFKKLKVDGFVFGILNEDNQINKEQNAALIVLASPLPCTFHRAFDAVVDRDIALETIIEIGFSAILTAGNKDSAVEGVAVIKDLMLKANGRITIIPGGGLRASNIQVLKQQLGAKFYHSSTITDLSELANSDEIVALQEALV